MSKDTLPTKRLENALTKLQDAQSALKLAADELAIVDAEMIGSDSHRRLIVESSAEDPIKTADDITSHRAQAAEIVQAAADVGKLAKQVKGKDAIPRNDATKAVVEAFIRKKLRDLRNGLVGAIGEEAVVAAGFSPVD